MWQTFLHNGKSLQSKHVLFDKTRLIAAQTDRIVVWNKETGNELWSYMLPEEDQGFIGSYWSDLVQGYFYLAGYKTVYKIQLGGGVTWSTRLSHRIAAVQAADTIVHVSLFKNEWRDDGVYEVGGLTALRNTNGDSLWSYPLTGTSPSYTAPLLSDQNTVYVGSNSGSGKHTDIFRTYAIDAYDGSLVWKTNDEIFTYHQIMIGDTIFGNDGLGLYALDKHTGTLLWQTDLEVGHGEQEVAYWNGYLYHQKGSLLHVVDASTGEIVIHKMQPPDNRTVFHVGTGSGSIFVQTTGHLYCYEPYQPPED